ncbi:MAG TPA: sialidase family protein [Chloroflexota bacterium]|nr:sialidase family protein [Chloroflexota bacterium]
MARSSRVPALVAVVGLIFLFPGPARAHVAAARAWSTGLAVPASQVRTNGPRADQFVDVDWLDPRHGWALVRSICDRSGDRCPEVEATADAGRTWRRVAPASAFGCAKTALCVRAIRFVTPRIGYLYGPALFMTANGGRTWRRVSGLPVESLAVAGRQVFRLVTRGTGCPGPCRPVLQTAEVGARQWAAVPTWHDESLGFGEQLVVGGHTLYTIFTGHRAGGARSAHATLEISHDQGRTWTTRGDPCGSVAGQEEDTSAVAAHGKSIAILCVARNGQGPNVTALSLDAGTTFTLGAPLPVAAPEQIAVGRSRLAVGNGGIIGGGKFTYELALSNDGGNTWTTAVHERRTVYDNLAHGSLQLINPYTIAWVGYPYYLWWSADGGRTWQHDPAP